MASDRPALPDTDPRQTTVHATLHRFQPDDLYPERCGWRDERGICGWAAHVGFHVPGEASGA